MFCLTTATDPEWAERALDAIDTLLVDHAHCELKAAASAVSLAGRLFASPVVVRRLVAIARDEMGHFEQVLDELSSRGLWLGAPPVDGYVAELRRRAAESARVHKALPAPVDMLLVNAIVEARSCERFKLLSEAAERRGLTREHALYRTLMESEAGHYSAMRALAIEAGGAEDTVDERLGELALLEGAITADLGRSPTMHG